MQAAVGDRIIIESATLGRAARFGEVLAVLGEQDGPPYRIRWDDGSESLYCPGPDCWAPLGMTTKGDGSRH